MVDRTGLHTAPVPGNPPLGTAPVDGRLVQAALFGSTGQCLNGGGLSASSATMAFTVAAGVYQIPDTANGGAVYHSPVDSAVLTPAAGQSGGRIDSIYVLQQDYEKNGTTSRVVYGLAAGTPGSGTAPSLSGIAGGPMRLANITVPASATKASDCTVSWVVPPAVLAAAGPVVANKALLDLIPGQYLGQRAQTGDGLEYRWSGSAWVLVALPTMRCLVQQDGRNDLAQGQYTTVGYSAVVSDPYGMNNGDGSQIKLPWSGLYRFWARFALQVDVPTSQGAGAVFKLLSNPSGGGPGEVMTWGHTSNRGQLYDDQVVATAGDRCYFQAIWYGTGSNGIAYGSNAVKTRFGVQYLGPA